MAAPPSPAIPNHLEPDLAEAVLAFNGKDYDGALRRLDALLAKAPKDRDSLELQALVYATKKSYTKAIDVYEKLIRLTPSPDDAKTVDEVTPDASPYYYELGRINIEQKRYDEAMKNLASALGIGFNRESCRLMMGVVELNRKNNDLARGHFESVVSGSVDELKPTAQLYLAQISGSMSDAGGAVRNYSDARSGAERQLGNESSSLKSRELAQQIIAAVDRGLRTYDRSVLLLNAGLLTGYDSNALAVPNNSVGTAGPVKAASTAVETLSYGLTYSSSPVKPFQFVPSYRGTLNYNTNSQTQNAQFFTHDVSLFVTRDALSLTNWGFKLEGIGILQYQTSTTSGGGTLGTYSVGASVGPYAKWEVNPGWNLGVDVFFNPVKNYTDAGASPTSARSGWEQSVRVFYARGAPTGTWNPGIALTTAWNHTSGLEFRQWRTQLDLGNTFLFTQKLIAAVGVNLGASWYYARPAGARQDQTVGAIGTAGYRFTDALTFLANLQLTRNLSSVGDYRYTRLIASAGVNYLF